VSESDGSDVEVIENLVVLLIFARSDVDEFPLDVLFEAAGGLAVERNFTVKTKQTTFRRQGNQRIHKIEKANDATENKEQRETTRKPTDT
jgi:hypothetical protein